MSKTLPFANLKVPVPGFGLMSLSKVYGPEPNADISLQTLAKAVEIGCTFWDTAVAYGNGQNESLVGEFFKKSGAREKVFIASKCGFNVIGEGADRSVTNSASHINSYIEGTKERLGSYPDLYYLHRIDPKTPLEESIGALAKLKAAGKCKYIGLSECSPETLRKACAIAHIDALQVEYSAWCTDYEENGLLDTARELGVAIIAFSPLGVGILSGKYRSPKDFGDDDMRRFLPRFSEENMPKNLRIVDEFNRLAEKKGCTSSQLALAWVIAQGAIPIPGTHRAERLEENFGARNVTLDEEELRELRKLVNEAKPEGARWPEFILNAMNK
ncbi:Aldo-keto reductase yakc [NADP(+)] [Saitozyma sp. JCM 24511]|nr:Aldo-keto reductase yakc [NADP(+)] [Saitozyma sp. JCM 24511]